MLTPSRRVLLKSPSKNDSEVHDLEDIIVYDVSDVYHFTNWDDLDNSMGYLKGT